MRHRAVWIIVGGVLAGAAVAAGAPIAAPAPGAAGLEDTCTQLILDRATGRTLAAACGSTPTLLEAHAAFGRRV